MEVFTRENHRDLAATVQAAFEEILLSAMRPIIQHQAYAHIKVIVLVGGCALNIKANSRIRKEFGIPVYVPAAPNDGGLSIGAAWHLTPPPLERSGLSVHGSGGSGGTSHGMIAYLGAPLWDAGSLPRLASEHAATKVSIADVVALLLDQKVIGVIRGRQA